MRLLISVVLYITALGLTLLGIAQQTVWAPDDSKPVTITLENPNPLLVISQEVLQKKVGQPVVTVSGPGKVYVATGRQSDIEAWVGGSSSTSITLDATGKKLTSNSVDGSEASANPNGSDLWRTERSATNKVSMRVATENENAVIIASDGLTSAPNTVSIEWINEFDRGPSNILIFSGFGLMLATVVYNFLVFRSIRNARRPRRKLPKAPQGPRSRRTKRTSSLPPRGRRAAGRNFLIAPTALILVSLVGGCTSAPPESTTEPTSEAEVIGQPAALELGQIRRIVTSVAKVAKLADEGNSTSQLLPRFAGPALAMRDAAYTLIKKSKKAPKLEPIYASPLTLSLPAATNTWPRSLMVATGAEEGRAPLMLVLRQDSPRKQYQVWYVATLASGVKLPDMPATADGSVPVLPDSAYLELAPQLLPEAYGSVIDGGPASNYFGNFELQNDTFYSSISEEQKKQVATLTKAKLTYQHVLADPQPIGLATADGGALVAVYMHDITTIKPKRSNSGITVNELQQVALGAKGSIKGIVSTYGDMLLFYVPSVGQDSKIRLLGWQTGLLKVKSL
jgi:hypothetical protein